MIRLIVNADDFGFNRDVNAGIVKAHREGILTATTLMANGDAFDDAARLARENPTLDVGCHLVLVQGRSVFDPTRELPADLPSMLRAMLRRELPIYDELKAQVVKMRAAGLSPSHLDSHKHTHLLPPVLEAVAKLAREFGIRWVRRPFDFGLDARAKITKRAVAISMRLTKPRFARALDGLRTTDNFTGFQLTGSLDSKRLMDALEKLPEGITEFMCHPGLLGPELQASPTRLKESRQIELEALTSPAARELIARRGILLTNYRQA